MIKQHSADAKTEHQIIGFSLPSQLTGAARQDPLAGVSGARPLLKEIWTLFKVEQAAKLHDPGL